MKLIDPDGVYYRANPTLSVNELALSLGTYLFIRYMADNDPGTSTKLTTNILR